MESIANINMPIQMKERMKILYTELQSKEQLEEIRNLIGQSSNI